MILDFEINNQVLTRTDNSKTVEKSQNYLSCRFDFKSADWVNVTKAALFKTPDMEKPVARLLVNDMCDFPNGATIGHCNIAVIGGEADVIDKVVSAENTALTGTIITTNTLCIAFDDTLDTECMASLDDPENDFSKFLLELDLTIKNLGSELIKGIGNLDDLKTTNKSDLVSALNEVNDEMIDTIGDLHDLETDDKSNIVSSINELYEDKVNNSTSNGSFIAGKGASEGSFTNVAIGNSAYAGDSGIALGTNARGTQSGISIGYNTETGSHGIAIGGSAKASSGGIQLGSGENSGPWGLNVFDYKLLDQYGIIPDERLSESIARKNDVSKLFKYKGSISHFDSHIITAVGDVYNYNGSRSQSTFIADSVTFSLPFEWNSDYYNNCIVFPEEKDIYTFFSSEQSATMWIDDVSYQVKLINSFVPPTTNLIKVSSDDIDNIPKTSNGTISINPQIQVNPGDNVVVCELSDGKYAGTKYWDVLSSYIDLSFIGSLDDLNTTDKTSIVAGINEVNNEIIEGNKELLEHIKKKIGFEETTVSADGSKYINWDNETSPKIYSVTADIDIPVGNDAGVMIIFKSGGFVEDVGMATVHLESDISQLYITGKDIYYRKQSNTTAEWTKWNKMTDLIGTLENLTTIDKSSIVAAINEVNVKIDTGEGVDLSGYATKEELGDKADKATANGGFAGGNAHANAGGAIGSGAYTTDGASIGYGALSSNGIAAGSNAYSDNGAALGNGAKVFNGGAVGNNAMSGDGFAGGKDAKCLNSAIQGIDAIQLGTGTNNTERTLQIYDYQLLDSAGNIPSERIPQLNNKSDKTSISTLEETAPTLNMSYNTEVRYGEVSSLTITLPQSFEDDYISSVVFTSGNEAVNLIYPEEIKMSGEDCMDGIFTPVENKRYTLILSYDGVYVSGIAGGVTI